MSSPCSRNSSPHENGASACRVFCSQNAHDGTVLVRCEHSKINQMDQPSVSLSNPARCSPIILDVRTIESPRTTIVFPQTVSPHHSRGFVTKPPKRQARWARGGQGTGSVVCGGASSALRTGTDAREKGASPQQYVDRPSSEPARRQACHSGVSMVAVEAFVNNAG
jgi:hypothetical protein